MISNMRWNFLALMLVVVPSIVTAAPSRLNRLGNVIDSVLRFATGEEEKNKISTPPEYDEKASPAFCNGLDCPKYTVLKSTSAYELRQYVATGWVSTASVDIDFDTAQFQNFMRLFQYIGGNNAEKKKIAMTAPVINRIIPGPGPACANNFTMSFFVAPKEGKPPKPLDSRVFISKMQKMKVYVRSFSGFAEKDDWLKEAVELAKALRKTGASYHSDFYYTAGYDSPFKLENRHNEIWFIGK